MTIIKSRIDDVVSCINPFAIFYKSQFFAREINFIEILHGQLQCFIIRIIIEEYDVIIFVVLHFYCFQNLPVTPKLGIISPEDSQAEPKLFLWIIHKFANLKLSFQFTKLSLI